MILQARIWDVRIVWVSIWKVVEPTRTKTVWIVWWCPNRHVSMWRIRRNIPMGTSRIHGLIVLLDQGNCSHTQFYWGDPGYRERFSDGTSTLLAFKKQKDSECVIPSLIACKLFLWLWTSIDQILTLRSTILGWSEVLSSRRYLTISDWKIRNIKLSVLKSRNLLAAI